LLSSILIEKSYKSSSLSVSLSYSLLKFIGEFTLETLVDKV